MIELALNCLHLDNEKLPHPCFLPVTLNQIFVHFSKNTWSNIQMTSQLDQVSFYLACDYNMMYCSHAVDPIFVMTLALLALFCSGRH